MPRPTVAWRVARPAARSPNPLRPPCPSRSATRSRPSPVRTSPRGTRSTRPWPRPPGRGSPASRTRRAAARCTCLRSRRRATRGGRSRRPRDLGRHLALRRRGVGRRALGCPRPERLAGPRVDQPVVVGPPVHRRLGDRRRDAPGARLGPPHGRDPAQDVLPRAWRERREVPPRRGVGAEGGGEVLGHRCALAVAPPAGERARRVTAAARRTRRVRGPTARDGTARGAGARRGSRGRPRAHP